MNQQQAQELAERHGLPLTFEVDDATGCWVWTSTLNIGYAVPLKPHRVTPATRGHQVFYRTLVGEYSDELHLDHLCRNPACVNPEHLEPVPPHVNVLRGESVPAKNARKTHCKHGHSLEDAYIGQRNGRAIRICRWCAKRQAERTREYHRLWARDRRARIRAEKAAQEQVAA